VNSFAYLFERFPSFTQTFCNREVAAMFAQEMNPAVYSIRPADDRAGFPREFRERVTYLPSEQELNALVRQLRADHRIHSDVWEIFRTWGDRGDKARLYEAAWLGLELRRRGIRHVHAHFAGMAARTAYWMKKFWRIGYSFTGHANDIFCETDFPVSLASLVREARLVVTETDYSRDWLRAKFPGHSMNIVRCYNGIDIERFGIREAAPSRRIISVGRCVEKKGFADLIEACRILRGRGVEFDCEIIGTGPLEDSLRAQIATAGLEQSVRMPGARTEEEISAALRNAQVFVLPCVREADGGSDNLPTVIMEAMACALPVISTPLAGVPEMVRDHVTGLLVPERSPGLLADALAQLLTDPALAQRCGEAGRRIAVQKFATGITTRILKHFLVARCPVRPPLAAFTADHSLVLRRLQRLLRIGNRFAPGQLQGSSGIAKWSG
jgi:colanic acid/amylovoran biosynthesis glycosyltransferase